jgi:GntR family transcriptional regulator, arabinose operon transcriptional repressor
MNKISDIQLYHDSLVSLHTQIHSQLRHLIMSGHWPKGTRIPSETQLTTHLNVSRSTIRLALQQVELEGLIERIPGKGTFVAYMPAQGNPKQLIAFMTSDLDDPKALDLLNGAESEIRASAYRIMFSNVKNHHEEIEALTRLQEENVAGVLVWPNSDYGKTLEQHAAQYRALRLPIVFLDRSVPNVECDYVTSDNYGGAYALVQHLIELGHQHIVFLSHPKLDIMTVAERYRAYQEALTNAGLTPLSPWLVGQDGHELRGNTILSSSINHASPEFQEAMALALNAPRPTAIVAVNDYLAILAMRVMKFMNIHVPSEISITGFDDIELAAHLEVPLTTAAQDAFMLGKRAAQLLIARLDGYAVHISHDIIPTQLRLRSSTSMPIRV